MIIGPYDGPYELWCSWISETRSDHRPRLTPYVVWFPELLGENSANLGGAVPFLILILLTLGSSTLLRNVWRAISIDKNRRHSRWAWQGHEGHKEADRTYNWAAPPCSWCHEGHEDDVAQDEHVGRMLSRMAVSTLLASSRKMQLPMTSAGWMLMEKTSMTLWIRAQARRWCSRSAPIYRMCATEGDSLIDDTSDHLVAWSMRMSLPIAVAGWMLMVKTSKTLPPGAPVASRCRSLPLRR
jgi:hypothetical protein